MELNKFKCCYSHHNTYITIASIVRARDGYPVIRIFIMPDNENAGMIETLFLNSVSEDNAFPCIDVFFECLEENEASTPRILDKAKVQIYLASRPEHNVFLGSSARADYWNLEHITFDSVKGFLGDVVQQV